MVIRECCRVWEQLKRRSSFQVLPTMDTQRKATGATRDLNHPAFQNIRVCQVRILSIIKQNGFSIFRPNRSNYASEALRSILGEG